MHPESRSIFECPLRTAGPHGKYQKTPHRPCLGFEQLQSRAFHAAEAFGQIVCDPRHIFFQLASGTAAAELKPWSNQIVDLYDGSPSVLPIAKTLLTIDLVISVDTMMAHLAGAMGRPVYTLLPYRCDWRWMMKRKDSPWYPTMRLFRQQRPGDWESAIRQLERALRALVSQRNFERHPAPHSLPSDPIAPPEVQEA